VKRRKGHKRKSRKPTCGLMAVITFSLFISTYSFLHPPNQADISKGFSYSVAIVDHLSLFEPNPAFVETSITILKKAGFTVDYYPGEEVSVNFFRNLPNHGYGLIILRVHSAIAYPNNWVSFFTSEPYSKTKYVYEQLNSRVGIACFQNSPPYFFGIIPDFIRLSAHGRFENTTVIMMGCNGLKYDNMAEAIVEKGARAYISWDGKVLASHTDKATIHLLQKLIIEKQTVNKAVEETMKEVGADPEYGSLLQYYPDLAEGYTI
jgi:hypothetical protein